MAAAQPLANVPFLPSPSCGVPQHPRASPPCSTTRRLIVNATAGAKSAALKSATPPVGKMRVCARPEVGGDLKASYVRALGSWTEAGQLPILYHPDYNISFFGLEKLHPFDPCKYEKVLRYLMDKGLFQRGQVVQPNVAGDEILQDVHDEHYIKTVSTSQCAVAQICELPPLALLPNFVVQNRVVRSMRRMTAGTMLAAGLAAEHGWAINLGGGMHHASSSQGQGWCMFDDHYLALRMLRRVSDGRIRKALYIDLDVHQGNGVCRDKLNFKDKELYVLDAFNCDVFPQDRHAELAVDCEIRLHCGVSDEEYLERLRPALVQAFSSFDPDIVLYNAGTDILTGDPLGRLKVSKEGIVQRDEIVFQSCLQAKVPVVMALSGGYASENWKVISQSLENIFSKFL